MKYKVKKGLVKYKGVFHPKGSFFVADKNDVQGLILSGIIVTDDLERTSNIQSPFEPTSVVEPSDMTIEELKKFLETADVNEVMALLEYERSKPDPRKTAIKLLEEWLQNEESEEDVKLPELTTDDVIVDGDGK